MAMCSIIYMGDHYQVVVRTDDEEDFVINSEYLWNEDDRVSLKSRPNKIALKLPRRIEKQCKLGHHAAICQFLCCLYGGVCPHPAPPDWCLCVYRSRDDVLGPAINFFQFLVCFTSISSYVPF